MSGRPGLPGMIRLPPCPSTCLCSSALWTARQTWAATTTSTWLTLTATTLTVPHQHDLVRHRAAGRSAMPPTATTRDVRRSCGRTETDPGQDDPFGCGAAILRCARGSRRPHLVQIRTTSTHSYSLRFIDNAANAYARGAPQVAHFPADHPQGDRGALPRAALPPPVRTSPASDEQPVRDDRL